MKKAESAELKKLNGAMRRIEGALLDLRTSSVEHDERRAMGQKIYKAIDRQKDFARRESIADAEALQRLEALRPQVPIAIDQASQNYNAENLRQMAEIEQRIRDRNASEGGFEKELAIARTKGGKGSSRS